MKFYILLLLSLVKRSYGWSSATSCPSGFNPYQISISSSPSVAETNAVDYCHNSHTRYSAHVWYSQAMYDPVWGVALGVNVYGYCCKSYGTTSADCTAAQHWTRPLFAGRDATCEADVWTSCPAGQVFSDGGGTSDGSCGSFCSSSQHTLNVFNGGAYNIRLVNGGGALKGRVEIKHNGEWGTVCDDLFDNNDAKVVCRSINANGGTQHQSAFFGQGSGSIWLDNLACGGTEASILDCGSNGIGSHNCGHGEDAGVTCSSCFDGYTWDTSAGACLRDKAFGYKYVFNGVCSNTLTNGFGYSLLPMGDYHILGDSYTYYYTTSREACIDKCASLDKKYSSYATNSVKCRCASVLDQPHDYSGGGGSGVYELYSEKTIQGSSTVDECATKCGGLGARGFVKPSSTTCYCSWADTASCALTVSAYSRYDFTNYASTSQQVCEAYAKSLGKLFVRNAWGAGNPPYGCSDPNNNAIYYNSNYNGEVCGWNGYNCVEIRSISSCQSDSTTSCSAGYSFSSCGSAFDGSCTMCAANQNSGGGTATCSADTVTSCSAGYYFNNGGPYYNGQCTACASSQHSAGGTTSSCSADTITSCSVGEEFSDGGKEYDGSCTQCASNEYIPSSDGLPYALLVTGKHCPGGGTGSSGGYTTLGDCMAQGEAEGATYISYAEDSNWCMRTTTCAASDMIVASHYKIYGIAECTRKSVLSCPLGSAFTNGGISSDNACTQCADNQHTQSAGYVKVYDDGYCSGGGHTSIPDGFPHTAQTCFEACKSSTGFLMYNDACWCASQDVSSCTIYAHANHYRYDVGHTSSCLADTVTSCDPNVGLDNRGPEYDSSCSKCLPKQYSSGTSPCAIPTFDRKYAVIDLGSVQNVVGMATRGRVDQDQRVTRYRVEYSTDGNVYFSINSEEFYFVREGECDGTEIRVYEGNGDNEGTIVERTDRCYEACITEKTALSGSWSGCELGGFTIAPSSGRCYCECVDSSTCSPIVNGYHRYDIAPNGVFEANHDRDTIVSNYFQPVRARYVKLSVVAYTDVASIRMAPILSKATQKVLNPPDRMRNSVECGSSMLDAQGTCLPTDGTLTIDLGKVQMVVGVVTQGRSDLEEYVTTYNLSYAAGVNFTDIQHTNRRFPANRDQHTKVTNYFEPVRARYIRLTPVTSKNAPSLRMGVVIMEQSMETQPFETKDRSEHTEVEYKDSIVYFGGVREYKKERKGRCASKHTGSVQELTNDYVKVEGLKVDDLARVKFTSAHLNGMYGEAVEIQTSGPIKFRKGWCNDQPQSKLYYTTNLMECYNICKGDYDVFIHLTTYCYCGHTKRYNCSDWEGGGDGWTSYESFYIEEEEGTKNWLFHVHDGTLAKMVLTRVKLIDNEVYIKNVSSYYKTATYAQWRAIDDWDEYIVDVSLTTNPTDGYVISNIRAEVSTSTLDLDTSYTGGTTAYADLKSCILMCQKDDTCHYISHAEERCMLHTTCTYEHDDRYTIYHVTKSQNVLTQHVYKDHGNPIKSATDCYAYAESLGFDVPETHTINVEGGYPDYEPMYTKWSSSGYCSSKYTLYDSTNLNPGTTNEEKLKHCAMGCRLYAGFAIEQNGPACYCSNDHSITCSLTNGNFDSYDFSYLLNPPELSRSYSGIWAGSAIGSTNAMSMIDSAKAWNADPKSTGGWMKIDLGGMFRVVGIVTQGHASSGIPQYTSKISIEYATLNTFTQITETTGGEFTANSDGTTKKVNFHQPVMARHIKIVIKDYSGHPSMRAGVMVDAELCKDKHGNYVWSHEKCSDLHVEGANGCIFDREKNTIRWNSNQYTGTSSVVCNATHQCIEQPNAGYMDVDPDFYLHHKGEASLSIEDCKLYANRMKKVFVEGEFDYPTGCSVHRRVYYNTKAGNNCTSMFPCVKRHGHYLTAYNKTSGEWYKIPTNAPPVQRYAHSATVSGDAMYIYGGKSYIDMGDLWKFNFTTSEWTRLYEGKPVAQAHMAAYKTGLLIHGGYESYGFVKSREDWNMPIKDTKYFDFETGMHAIERRPIVRVEYVRQFGGSYCNDHSGPWISQTIGTLHERLTNCSRLCNSFGHFSYNSGTSECYCKTGNSKTCTPTSQSGWDGYDTVDPFGQYEYHKSVNMFYSDYAGGNNGAERAYYNKESYHAVGEYECEQLCEASSDCHAYQYSGTDCWLRKNVQLRNVKSGSNTAMVKDKRFALGHSDLSVTLEECFNYADIYKMESKELYDDKQYKGCFHGDDNIMYYNYMGTECKERCLYRNELDNAPIVVDGDTMVIGKRMSAEVFRPYARSCVEWDEFETNDKLRPRGCFQKDNQVNYNNAPPAAWKMMDYGDDSDTYYLHLDFVSVSASSVEECLTACESYPFASYTPSFSPGCRCANTDSNTLERDDGGGVYTKNEITCSQEYKCVDDNDRKSYDLKTTIEGIMFNRKVKNPEAICIADGSEEAELKTQAPVLEALREYNDRCNFLRFFGTCDIVATWEECKRYGATEIESLADKPNGCYLMDGVYHFNEIGGDCTQEMPCYCRTASYQDILTGRCKEISENPIIKSIVYQDRDTDVEIQTELECQVNSEKKITCAQCECFADYTYGTWGGGMCETCAIGYGKTQCSSPCVDYDGLNRGTMCGGYGKCLFGSSISGVERIFQNTECICGQEDQYQLREPEHSVDAYFKSAANGVFLNDAITDGKIYDTEEAAKLECEKYNDLRFIEIDRYCFGVFIRSSDNLVFEIQLGKLTEFREYFRYIEKALFGSTSKSFSVEEFELTNLIPSIAVDASCYDDITISLEGYDTCNHFASDSLSCTRCADGWTGKNCRAKCQNCLLGGNCASVPSDEEYAACVCSSGNLWEHQCCPSGFKVVELLDWSNLPKSKINNIKIQSAYDAFTNNEKDASFYCKKCPGVDVQDWMADVAEFKVCSGETRGECIISGNSLACACKLNEESGMTWRGRACSCDDNIMTPYSSDPRNAETTDYGCLIPTGGTAVCPDPNPTGVTSRYYLPKQLWSTRSYVDTSKKAGNYLGGSNYIGAASQLLSPVEWQGGVASTIFVVEAFNDCSPRFPCHTGEGPCSPIAMNTDCAGTLRCSDRSSSIDGYDPTKVSAVFNFCYDPNAIMVGCDPIIQSMELSTASGANVDAAFNYKFWNGQTFQEAPLNHYVPMTKDANYNLIIHKQAFPCPVGRIGTLWDGIRECQLCEAGKYNDQVGVSECTDCPEGTFSTIIGAIGEFECENCPDGYRPSTTGQGCEPCPIRTFGVGGICEPCTTGKYNNIEAQTQCTKCNPGYFTYGTAAYSCTACPSGRYNGQLGLEQNECHKCPAGKYNDVTALTECKLCPSGRADTREALVQCDQCALGKFQENTGQTACDSCYQGKYADVRGLAICKNCAQGSYEDSTGSSSCKTCPKPKYSDEEGLAVCKDCLAGRYGLTTGQTACHLCGTGKFQNVVGQTGCKDCPAGTYGDQTGEDSPNCKAISECNIPNNYEGPTHGANGPTFTFKAGATHTVAPPYSYYLEYHNKWPAYSYLRGFYWGKTWGSTYGCASNCAHYDNGGSRSNIRGFGESGWDCHCWMYGGYYSIYTCNACYETNNDYSMYTVMICPRRSGSRPYTVSSDGTFIGSRVASRL